MVKESAAVIAGRQAGSPGQLMLEKKNPELPEGFQQSIFKSKGDPLQPPTQGMWSACAQISDWLMVG